MSQHQQFALGTRRSEAEALHLMRVGLDAFARANTSYRCVHGILRRLHLIQLVDVGLGLRGHAFDPRFVGQQRRAGQSERVGLLLHHRNEALAFILGSELRLLDALQFALGHRADLAH